MALDRRGLPKQGGDRRHSGYILDHHADTDLETLEEAERNNILVQKEHSWKEEGCVAFH